MDVLKIYTFKDFTFLICFWFCFSCCAHHPGSQRQWKTWGFISQSDLNVIHTNPQSCRCCLTFGSFLYTSRNIMNAFANQTKLFINSPGKLYQLMSKTKQTLANRPVFVYLRSSFSHWLIQKLLGANDVFFLIKGLIAEVWGTKPHFLHLEENNNTIQGFEFDWVFHFNRGWNV